NWIRGGKDTSNADQVLGSLGVTCSGEAARKQGYSAAFRSILLYERGRGTAATDLERRWSVANPTGVEEQWRDRLLWLLSGLSKILEVRCFYYFLKEHCGVNLERVRRVEDALRRMRRQVFGLQEHLKYCSPLGGVLRSMKRSQILGVGQGTIHRLE